MNQMNLFAAPTTAFKAGDIVRQTHPFHGNCDTVFPYYLVRFAATPREMGLGKIKGEHPNWGEHQVARALTEHLAEPVQGHRRPDTPMYYCQAIPFGAIPGEVCWMEEEDISATGLNWRIPTYHEIDMWWNEERNGSEFGARLNLPTRRTGPGEWICELYQPFKAEAELVALLLTLKPKWDQVTRDNFWAHFPEPATNAQGQKTFTLNETPPVIAAVEVVSTRITPDNFQQRIW